MTYPRSLLVNPAAAGVYHCVSRCVRRAWLCGEDALTLRNFDHRRQWVEDRLGLLAECFAISVYSFAVMSNHLHVVVSVEPDQCKHWSDDEVLLRWSRVMRHREREPAAPAPVSDERILQLDILGHPSESGETFLDTHQNPQSSQCARSSRLPTKK